MLYPLSPNFRHPSRFRAYSRFRLGFVGFGSAPLLLFLFFSLTCGSQDHVFRERVMLLSTRRDIVRRSAIQNDFNHSLIFMVRQNNLGEMERALHDVSDVASPNYGKHWSGEQVVALTANPAASDAIATYLTAHGATIMSETLGREYITAVAPLYVWNAMLNTKFRVFHQKQRNGMLERLVRANEYSVPTELDAYVHHVLNVIEVPIKSLTPTIVRKSDAVLNGWVLPANIREFYNMHDVYGSDRSTQAIGAFNEDYYSPKSLAAFQKMTNQPDQPAILMGGYASENKDLDYAESNLDVQFIMGVSPRSPTTYWHSPGGIFTWLIDITNTVNPPLVLSVSYGADESTTSKTTHDSVTILAMKLGLRGVSIFAASGDDGASSFNANANANACGYDVVFPAANPYFTAVGATSVRFSHHPFFFCVCLLFYFFPPVFSLFCIYVS